MLNIAIVDDLASERNALQQLLAQYGANQRQVDAQDIGAHRPYGGADLAT